MAELVVSVGPHPPMLAVQAHGLSAEECEAVRSATCCRRVDSEDYRLRKAAGAFLQGFEPPRGGAGWVLVEFWTGDRAAVDAFVRHLNSKLAAVRGAP